MSSDHISDHYETRVQLHKEPPFFHPSVQGYYRIDGQSTICLIRNVLNNQEVKHKGRLAARQNIEGNMRLEYIHSLLHKCHLSISLVILTQSER